MSLLVPSNPKVAVPIVYRSPELTDRGSHGSIWSHNQTFEPRLYDSEPLPFKPSDHAPLQARIIDRVAEPDRVSYTVQVGTQTFRYIGIDEILDYVSAYDLEQYENQKFEEERELLRVARLAEEENERRREAKRATAKTKGTVIFQEIDSDDSERRENAVGRHGRSRPTYTHLFDQARERRRRRKRDPFTGELMPLSDGETDDVITSAEALQPESDTSAALELSKRRRRKRDKITGELLPLEPAESEWSDLIKQKRRRRKRHPQTGELMPLGWRWNPEIDGDANGSKSGEYDRSAALDIETLNLDREEISKRRKITPEPFPHLVDLTEPRSSRGISPVAMKEQGSLSSDATSDGGGDEIDCNDTDMNEANSQATSIPQPGHSSELSTRQGLTTSGKGSIPLSAAPSGSVTLQSFLEANRRRTMSPDESISGSEMRAPQFSETKPKSSGKPKTSIMNPIAISSDEESSQDELAEDEWVVEEILAHRMSDPKTHPGKKTVMLYEVKWVGFDEYTWEPRESFTDPNVVRAYRKCVGLDGDRKKRKGKPFSNNAPATGGASA